MWPWLKSNVSRSWYIKSRSWYIKQCTLLGIHYSMWSKPDGKWRERRQQKHCQLQAKKQWFFKLSQEDQKQQLVEEKDADNIRKVLGKSVIQWFWELNLCCYEYPIDCFGLLWLFFLLLLKWKSRNITKHLMSGPLNSGKPISFVFPRVLMFPETNQDS